jgi:membrane-bound metal-dependent hydrolase YbcI (DUF457 family)
VILWFAGLSFLIVWSVFRDTAIDYRLVMAGALLPDVIDAAFGGPRVAHTLIASVALLTAVMLGTRGRRAWRRRLLALPIGTFCHLVLDGVWTRSSLLWWPFLGSGLHDRGLPSVERPAIVLVLMECAGAAALIWLVARFRLHDAQRWRVFLRTGRLGRDLREVTR